MTAPSCGGSSSGGSVVLPPEVRPLSTAAAFFPGRLAALFFGRESAFLIAADAAMRMQPFEDKLGGRCPDRVRLIGRQAQHLDLLHEALDSGKLLDHGGRIDVLVELEASA